MVAWYWVVVAFSIGGSIGFIVGAIAIEAKMSSQSNRGGENAYRADTALHS